MEVNTMHNACDDMSAAKALSKQNRVTIIIELAENGEPMWEGAINGCIFRIRECRRSQTDGIKECNTMIIAVLFF